MTTSSVVSVPVSPAARWAGRQRVGAVVVLCAGAGLQTVSELLERWSDRSEGTGLEWIAANPDALVYGDTYSGTTSLRTDQDLHPALLKRYAGRRINYASLYGCGVPETAHATRQLQDALRAVAP